jgi:hypothetical protein
MDEGSVKPTLAERQWLECRTEKNQVPTFKLLQFNTLADGKPSPLNHLSMIFLTYSPSIGSQRIKNQLY